MTNGHKTVCEEYSTRYRGEILASVGFAPSNM